MSRSLQLLVFRLDEQRYALPLEVVQRVTRAVELTPLPGAPESVLGVIDLQGEALPVPCLRRRFNLPQREIDPGDHLVIARAGERTMALVIDYAEGVSECALSQVIDMGRVSRGLEQFHGAVRLDDGMVLIHDLETLLSRDEALTLDAAMEEAA